MWTYEKRLQCPVNITKTCPQDGIPDYQPVRRPRRRAGRFHALSQPALHHALQGSGRPFDRYRYRGIGPSGNHLRHYLQLTKNLTPEQVKTAGFDAYYIDHTTALWPTAAAGVPFNACEFQSKGDAITDLHEDLAAEQKARTTYDNLIRVIDNSEVLEPLKFLREREVVHFQRFGEALEKIKSQLDAKNFYYFNAEFDKQFVKK